MVSSSNLGPYKDNIVSFGLLFKYKHNNSTERVLQIKGSTLAVFFFF